MNIFALVLTLAVVVSSTLLIVGRAAPVPVRTAPSTTCPRSRS